ncbi:MAG: AraC family transcriptional regulator, partial [Spirochaetaceae bacterium]|nr:AraC family transcriptional regulator [Spirochaetaceae bacterium]
PNQFNFSRAFRRIMGKSPREWRNENKLREGPGYCKNTPNNIK